MGESIDRGFEELLTKDLHEVKRKNTQAIEELRQLARANNEAGIKDILEQIVEVRLQEMRLSDMLREEKDKNEQKEKEQGETKRSPFSSFYQVNKGNSQHLVNLAIGQPTAMAIFLFLVENMDNYNAVVCSHKVLQERLNLGQATVARAVKYLKDNNFISVGKSGTSNVYTLNSDLVWNSYGRNLKYCKFPANVILTSSEQTEDNGKKKKQSEDKKKITNEYLQVVSENEEGNQKIKTVVAKAPKRRGRPPKEKEEQAK